jgi:CRP/FNR family transcriptional regulator, cyclic AMP receptor protein
VEVLEIFRDSPNARSVAAGEAIFRRGEPGDVMYVVLDGEVEIVADGHTVERLNPGSIFGEMAIVDDSPRSADAVAQVDTRLAPVDRKWFTYLIRQSPQFGLHVMSVMASRLRRFMDERA